MKRLVGNQRSVEIAHGDTSYPFYKSTVEEFATYLSWRDYMGDPLLIADLDYICLQAFKQGYLLDRVDAYYAWNEHSQAENASWLSGANLETCRKFLVEVEVSETAPVRSLEVWADYEQMFIKWNEELNKWNEEIWRKAK